LLGLAADFQFDHAINKPPRTGAETPWHQDEAYWDPALEYSAFSIWMPLQEATLDNGCMQFVPDSHQLGVQPHHHIGNDPKVHGLEIDQIDASRAVACPLPAGGATIHSSQTLHYAGPNLTDQPRRAYILAFSAPPKPRAVTRSFPWL
jgi:ectoine hydroxylase-related dioxygenase (phytanoyl-CoA dioxygenase family)